MAVTTVVFDLGETLLDETEMWGGIADRVGVTRLTFSAMLGAMIERGEEHTRVFDAFGVEQEHADPAFYCDENLYPDARPCLDRLRAAGFAVGVAANQPLHAAPYMDSFDDLCVVGCSAVWGCAKPAPEFFSRLIDEVGVPAREIAYVGDRVDRDVEPALAAGMTAVHIRRGPWGYLRQAPDAAIRISSLDELPEALP